MSTSLMIRQEPVVHPRVETWLLGTYKDESGWLSNRNADCIPDANSMASTVFAEVYAEIENESLYDAWFHGNARQRHPQLASYDEFIEEYGEGEFDPEEFIGEEDHLTYEIVLVQIMEYMDFNRIHYQHCHEFFNRPLVEVW